MRPTTASSKDEIEARNRADAMVYNVEKMLKEHRDKIGDADAKSVEDGARRDQEGDRRTAISRQINAATDKLTAASHKLAEAMYKAHRAARAAPAAPGLTAAGRRRRRDGEKPKDNVVDAEFVDVDDKK